MASRSNSNSNFSESSYDYDDKEQPSAPTSDWDDPLIPGLRNNSFNGLLGFTVGSKKMRKKKPFYQERAILGLALFVVAFVGANWWMLSRIQNSGRASQVEFRFLKDNSSTLSIRDELVRLGKGRKPQKTIYARLLAKAAHSLAEGWKKSEPKDLWAEPYFIASSWKPCAELRNWQPSGVSLSFSLPPPCILRFRSAILLLLQDYWTQHWFFRDFCTVVFGKM